MKNFLQIHRLRDSHGMNQRLFHRWKEYLWVLKIARCWRERFRVLASMSKEINNQRVRWYAVGVSR
jgi:hypothetical protein